MTGYLLHRAADADLVCAAHYIRLGDSLCSAYLAYSAVNPSGLWLSAFTISALHLD